MKMALSRVGARHMAPDRDERTMARMLRQTDAQITAPEASRQHEAMTRLRGAVAATEAARRLGEAARRPEGREAPFRDDLRRATRTADASEGIERDDEPLGKRQDR